MWQFTRIFIRLWSLCFRYNNRRNKLSATQPVSVLFLIWQHVSTSVSIFRSVNLKIKFPVHILYCWPEEGLNKLQIRDVTLTNCVDGNLFPFFFQGFLQSCYLNTRTVLPKQWESTEAGVATADSKNLSSLMSSPLSRTNKKINRSYTITRNI
jgi:hypothetical protein